MVKFVNLTPHPIRIFRAETPARIARHEMSKYMISEIPPSGTVLRLKEEAVPLGRIDGVEIVRKSFSIPGLPGQRPGTIYIVSSLLLLYVPAWRSDFVAPDTGAGAVRDLEGRIIGVKRFFRV